MTLRDTELRFTGATPLKIVVLASGSGTLFQAMLDHWVTPATATAGSRTTATQPEDATNAPVEIAALIADKPCEAVRRAEQVAVSSEIIELPRAENPQDKPLIRAKWDSELTEAVSRYNPDIVVSAGFMKILGDKFLDTFGGRTINTHPALLPAFPGAHAVHDAVEYGAKVTGSTIHLVDRGVDTGPILAQEAVPITSGESVSQVHERIKKVERRLLVTTLETIARHGYTTDGRKATLLP